MKKKTKKTFPKKAKLVTRYGFVKIIPLPRFFQKINYLPMEFVFDRVKGAFAYYRET